MGFTGLLGLIYLRAYSSALRVPESEFQKDDVLAYALASPDMAILGVGTALFSVVAGISLTRRVIPIPQGWPTLLVGLILLAINLVMFLSYRSYGILESGTGALGIWTLFYSASMSLGTALALSALISWYTSNGANVGNDHSRLEQAFRVSMAVLFYVLGLGTIILMLAITVWHVSEVGRMDASVHLRDAPLVELTSESQTLSSILMRDETESGTDQLANRFKLVHVGDRFVYIRLPEFSLLSPEDAGLGSGVPYQFAIPVAEIASITQIVDPE